MDDTTERIAPTITDEFREMAELTGCTDMQVKFAACLLAGSNFTEAAWNAGYAGARDSVQLRTTGSQAARAKPVQALLALAESRGLGVPDAPGDRDELKKILWRHARSADKAHSIKASTELMRIESEEKVVAEPQGNPLDTLKLIAETEPLIALLLYESVDTNPSSPVAPLFVLTPEQQAKANILKQKIATDYLNQLRSKQIAGGNVVQLNPNLTPTIN